jgi:hypothetical protein
MVAAFECGDLAAQLVEDVLGRVESVSLDPSLGEGTAKVRDLLLGVGDLSEQRLEGLHDAAIRAAILTPEGAHQSHHQTSKAGSR